MKKFIILLMTLLTSLLYAQDMEMTDTNGATYKVYAKDDQFEIEGMKGKVVLLEFFGLQCPACKEIMPNLIEVQEKYPEKVKVLAIDIQNNEIDPINKYKKEHNINYTTFSNYDIGLVVRYIADNSDWQGAIPFLVVIDKKGEIKILKQGVTLEETLEEYVEKYSK